MDHAADTLETLLTRYCRASNIEVPVLMPWEGDKLRILYDMSSGMADVLVPLAMLDMPPDEVAFRIHDELTTRHILAHLYPIARPYMPHLTEAIEQLCLANGIHQLPALLGTTSPFCSAMALQTYNAIILGDDVLKMRPEQQLAIISHELGHLLNPGLDGMESERAADKAAVQLMGSSRPVVTALKRSESTQVFVKLWAEEMDGEDGRIRAALHTKAKAELASARYGTETERLAYIRAQKPQDRSHLEQLIAERDARLFAETLAKRQR